MTVNKVYSIYYSGTGTTQKIVSFVGEHIAKVLNVPFEKYNFSLPKNREKVLEFKENELVICGSPTYAGRIPNVMLPFYKNNIKASGALAVPIVLFGNRNFDDSLIELRNTLEENGFRTIAGAAFIGEHAFSYTLAAKRPDESDMQKALLFADKVAEKKDEKVSKVDEKEAIKKFNLKLKHKNIKIVLISIFSIILIAFIGWYSLYVNEYTIKYTDNLVNVKIPEDEGIDIKINERNYKNGNAILVKTNENNYDIYINVTQNILTKLFKDSDQSNNLIRIGNNICIDFQSEKTRFYLPDNAKINNIYYIEDNYKNIKDLTDEELMKIENKVLIWNKEQ